MADLEARKYDELEKVLAARPLLKAPETLRANVMARIAALPQSQQPARLTNTLNPKYAAPVVNFLPDQALYEQAAIRLAEEKVARQQSRLLAGFIFSGMWLGLYFLIVWLLWPGISNLVFGPSSDPEMQTRLAGLQAFWNDLSGFVGQLISNYGSLIPTLLSLTIGLVLMVGYLVGPDLRRKHLFYQ